MLVVLGLGSNLPFVKADGSLMQCNAILDAACVKLSENLANLRCSSIYQTKARYVENQADFLNMVVCGEWNGTARELLEICQNIENSFGRVRLNAIEKGPRTLDIDIELFGNEIIKEENCLKPLIIPHSLIQERQFVLIPLLEILPECADPITGQKYSQILANLGNQGVELWKQHKKS